MQHAQSVTSTQNTNNPYASASLYVGDLANDVTEATLFELFNAVGPVASIRVCRDAISRRSLGYSYVNFHSVQDAERALDTMNYTNIRGKQCRIMWSQRDPRLRQSGKGNIFVKNLHESIDNKTLYDTFSVFGNILSCKVATDRDSGESRGYGYVHYVDNKSAQKAIEGVNGMTISEKQVHAELFKPREQRKLNIIFTNVYVKYIPKFLDKESLKCLFESETGGVITALDYWARDYGISACLNFKTPENAKKAVTKLNGREFNSDDNKNNNDDNKDEDKAAAAAEASDESKAKEDNKDEKEKEKDDNKDNKVKCDKLYVARAQKQSERKEFLLKQARKKGGRSFKSSGTNLYVKNLGPHIDDKKLEEMFESYGEITSAKVMMDSNTGRSKGFGFVAYKKKESATAAMHEMSNTIHFNKPLYVSRAQSKQFRQSWILKQLRNKQARMRNESLPHYGGGYPTIQQRQFNNYGGTAAIQQFGGYRQIQAQPQAQFQQTQLLNRTLYPVPPPTMNRFPQIPMPSLPHAANQTSISQIQPFIGQNMGFPASGINQVSSIQQQLRTAAAAAAQQQQQAPSQQSRPQQSGSMYQQQSATQAQQFSQNNNGSQGGGNSQNQTGVKATTPSQSQSQSHHSGPHVHISAPMLENHPLTTDMLTQAKPAERKRLIGERLFPKIQVVEPRLAGKITGMLLEMDNTELLVLLGDQNSLMRKINEALAVLKDHQQKQSQSNVASGHNSATNTSQKNKGSTKNTSQSNTNQ